MKSAWFILFVVLISCNLNNKKTEADRTLITSLSEKEIAICNNVIFRKRGDSLVKFQIRQLHRDFVFPFPNYPHDTTKGKDIADCYEYATLFHIDSNAIHEFIRRKGDSLERLIDKYGILYIFNDKVLGDFTVFQVRNDGQFIYMPKDGIIRYQYWDTIINDKNRISDNWYFVKR